MVGSDAVGPDGKVRLRLYLPMADSVWFVANCEGCGRAAPVGVRPAIQFLRSAEATIGDLEQRMRCSRCGRQHLSITTQRDTRTAEAVERNGPASETRAGVFD
jgi:hypothetical protein